LKALEIRANAIIDMHLQQTKLKIPQTFREGLKFNIEYSPSSPKKQADLQEGSKDEGIAVEVGFNIDNKYRPVRKLQPMP
jgi:hypothetical protein